MLNQQGYTSLVALKLQRDCFSSEDDRLNEYAKALRVPIQTGEIIKGDAGTPGPPGPRGPAGARGANGIDGQDPAMESTEVDIAMGVDNVTLVGDVRHKIVNLHYEDIAADPPLPILGILCLRFDGTDTTAYLSDTTPDALYRIKITSY